MNCEKAKVQLDVPGTGFLCFDGRPISAARLFSDGSLSIAGSDIGDSCNYEPGSDEWSFRFGETKRSDFDFEHSIEMQLVPGRSVDGADDRWAIADHALKSPAWTDLLLANGVAIRKLPQNPGGGPGWVTLADGQSRMPRVTTIYQPSQEYMPGTMLSSDVFLSLANGKARYPEIPDGAWLTLNLGCFGAATIIDFPEMPEDQSNPQVPKSGGPNSPDHEFKNFHRLLCERFDYSHDDIDWRRDQLSLIEWIAKRKEAAERQRDDLLKAITLIAAQSVGDDWTVEQAYAFVKQHARDARNAARAEMSVSQAK